MEIIPVALTDTQKGSMFAFQVSLIAGLCPSDFCI